MRIGRACQFLEANINNERAQVEDSTAARAEFLRHACINEISLRYYLAKISQKNDVEFAGQSEPYVPLKSRSLYNRQL